MLDNLQLIHMNGRVYDPWLARFLSADPYIPDPTDTQSYNRYSYVQNNPLSFVDPSGFRDTVPNWYGDWTDWTTPWMWPNFPTYRPPAVVSPCGSNECKNDKPLPAFAPTSASPCDFMPCGSSSLGFVQNGANTDTVDEVRAWICIRGISDCDDGTISVVDPSKWRGGPVDGAYPPERIPGGPWRWFPNKKNSRGGAFRDPKGKSANWDPDGHWDVDDGKGGTRKRYDRWGNETSLHKPPRANAPRSRPIPKLARKALKGLGIVGALIWIKQVLEDPSILRDDNLCTAGNCKPLDPHIPEPQAPAKPDDAVPPGT